MTPFFSRKFCISIWIFIGCMICSSSMVFAAVGSPVYLDDQVILRIRFAAGGFSPPERADLVQSRLNSLINRPNPPRIALVRYINGVPVVVLGDTPLITVDIEHARANGTTPRELARIWATNIEQALDRRFGQPQPPPSQRSIPFTTLSQISQGGVAQHQFRVFTNDAQWRRFWQTVHERPIRVNFNQDIVLGVFMGQRPTGGYGIEVTRIDQTKNQVLVTVLQSRPAPGSVVPQALTTPQHLIRVSRSAFLPRRNLTFLFVSPNGQELGRVSNVNI